MARVFIVDRWLKNDENGNPPTAAMKRSLANAKDPMKAKVPAEHRSSTYGKYDRWRCRWYAEAQGVKTEKSKTFRLLSDAEEFKAAMEDDIRRGRYHDPKLAQKPFRRVAEEWTATKADIKPGTLRRYKRELRIYINPQWGDTPHRGHQDGSDTEMGEPTVGGRLSGRQKTRNGKHSRVEATVDPQHRARGHGRCARPCSETGIYHRESHAVRRHSTRRRR